MNERSDNSGGSVEIKGMPNTAYVTDVVMTGDGQLEYLFYKGEGRVKSKADYEQMYMVEQEGLKEGRTMGQIVLRVVAEDLLA